MGTDGALWRQVQNRLGNSRLALPLIGIIYIAIVTWLVPRGTLDADEGFYCAAARRVMQGSLPYRDFGYTQTPALAYLNGLVMEVTGFGFVRQRAVNAGWALATLLVIYRLGCVVGDRYPALIAVWVTTWSLPWIYNAMLGKAYGATGLFLSLAALAIYEQWKYRSRTWLFAIAAAIAIGCRLTIAPMLGVLWLILIWRGPTIRDRVWAIVLPLVMGLVTLLPFFLADPENFLFWTLEFHLSQTLTRRGDGPVGELIRLAPGAVILFVASTMTILVRFRQMRFPALGLYLAVFIGIAVHLSLRYSYGEYSTPYVPLLILVSSVILFHWQVLRPFGILLLLAPAMHLIGVPPKISPWPDALPATAEFVQQNTPEDGRILTPIPIVAYEAHRDVLSGLEMGKFALTTELSAKRAHRLHLVTPETLTDFVVQKHAAAVVMHVVNRRPTRWNFSWSVPSFRQPDATRMQRFNDALRKHYRVAFVREPFVVMLPVDVGSADEEQSEGKPLNRDSAHL